jgi:hypothetical protein
MGMSNFDTLHEQVVKWFHDKGIIQNSDPLKQLEKTQEELTETRDAVVRYIELHGIGYSLGEAIPELKKMQDQAYGEIVDGIGDQLVTLIGVCEMLDINLVSCLDVAYAVISKRSGKMVDGKFVKD